MSATDRFVAKRRKPGPGSGPRARPRHRPRSAAERGADPRVLRSRAAVVDAARALFLENGYAGTTMDQIADRAGIAKRTVYNNYTDKAALFTEIVEDAISYAEEFARGLHDEFAQSITRANLPAALHGLARRMAVAILRPEVIALRRLLIGEAKSFPHLAKSYFDRAPGRVLIALADGFEHLSRAGLLITPDARRAAEQFAYLVVGEPLDRAVLVGKAPAKEHAIACAAEGVETFLARYAPSRPLRASRARPSRARASREPRREL